VKPKVVVARKLFPMPRKRSAAEAPGLIQITQNMMDSNNFMALDSLFNKV
jgi:hypothetical protein